MRLFSNYFSLNYSELLNKAVTRTRGIKQSSAIRIFLLIDSYPRDSEICDDAVAIYHPRVRTLKELLYADGALLGAERWSRFKPERYKPP